MEYRTIPTTLGRAKLEQAALLQVPLELTLVEFGDGNGAEYLPTGQETALKRKVYEAPPNMLADAAEAETWVELHAVLPFDVGGWWLREFIVRDAAGDAIFIGNLPESFKPIGSTGAIKDIAFELVFDILSPDSVTLKVDPSKVLATRKFVEDYVAQELAKLDAKQSVRVATTAAIALSGLLSVDGVQLVAGNRVLVKNQADGAQNGIYVAAAGAWPRAADADAALEVTPGMLVPVEQGTVNADSVWQLVSDAPINLGATELVFEIATGPTGLAVGTYRSITVDKRGRVVGGTNPTTLAGYGITDAMSSEAEASKAEAEAGEVQGKWMSPLRVFQAMRSAAAKATEALIGALRVGTQAEVNTGTLDDVAVTPKKLRWGFAISLTANGYIAFPSWLFGLILQWGTSAALAMDTDNAIALPLAFPSAGLGALITGLNATSNVYADNVGQVKSLTTTTLTIWCNAVSGNYQSMPYMWLAIGH
jgi:phage-related tail fiber protein